MKLSNQYALREIAGNYIVVPFGENTLNFNTMITLNETGAFLWRQMEGDKDGEQLLAAMLEEYEIDEATARKDIDTFLKKLEEAQILIR